ncbi:MAG: hypothetical protein OXT72_02025 [Gammaproteobacteria bacterium]|nr:hypothetical protein [Gammaproteobacteria bacterium]MDE0246715.1 hypothetical protein [Gammaproteobacteria bacterium]
MNGRTGVSVKMAIRLSKALGSTHETWLGMQVAYDLSQARGHGSGITVGHLAAASPLSVMTPVYASAAPRPARS